MANMQIVLKVSLTDSQRRGPIDPGQYVNPLPHVLMLTAIVVSVAIFGLALAFLIRIYQQFHTLDEEEILRQVQE